MGDLGRLIRKLKGKSWQSIWAGDWSSLDCSDWGKFYTRHLKVEGRVFLKRVIFIYQRGKVSAWVEEKDIAGFSKHLAGFIGSDIKKVKELGRKLKEKTDGVLAFMKRNSGVADGRLYGIFLKSVRDYYRFHIQIKYLADALPQNLLPKFLPILSEARVYAEPVFTKVIEFDARLADALSRKIGLEPRLLLMANQSEMKKIFKTLKPPDTEELKKRWEHSALIIDKASEKIFCGAAAGKVEDALLPSQGGKTITGQMAFVGRVRGRVKIILDPIKSAHFKPGDILVADMTRVEYLPIMKKAGAIVTDAGGLLCHAAITARELKKPCVIGTKIATKVFKDGDLVEVDADKGVVKIIK